MLGFIPASHYAEELLEKALKEKWTIVVSDLVKEEVFDKNVLPADFDAKISELRIRTNSVIVTRNIKHFKLVEDLVEVRKPEDLL